MKNLREYLEMKIDWQRSTETDHPFKTTLQNGDQLKIRENYGHTFERLPLEKRNMIDMPGFPDEPMYTLILNGQELSKGDFDDFPSTWSKDKTPAGGRGK